MNAAPSLPLSLARWLLCLATAVPWLGLAAAVGFLSPVRGIRIFQDWGRLQCRIFGIDVAMEDRNGGRYDSPPYLFVQLNQTSLAETVILPPVVNLPFRIMMNMEYALIPLVGWFYWAIGSVVVVRQWKRQAVRALDKAIRLLKQGHNFVMSAEGYRSPDGRPLPYKKGPATVAIASGATIVPLAVDGAHGCLPYGEWRVRPGKVRVIACEVIPTRGLTYEDRDKLTERLRAIAEKELETPGTPFA